MSERIRVISLGLCIHERYLLLHKVGLSQNGQPIFRPLGGEVEFGETSQAAVIREFKEEINCNVIVTGHLGWLENIFSHLNNPGHEIVSVFNVKLPTLMYQKACFIGNESNNESFEAKWIHISDFLSGDALIVPKGIFKMVRSNLPRY